MTENLNSSSPPNLKIRPLSSDEIQAFTNENESIYELPYKLFPSPYQVVDIMGYSEDDFYYQLELFDPSTRLHILRELFRYCSDLKRNPTMIETASTINNKSESLDDTIHKLQQQIQSENCNNSTEIQRIQTIISNCELLSNFIQKYQVNNIDWIFIIIARFMKNHPNSTESFLWSFCCEYFENNELKTLSSLIKDDTGIELIIVHQYNFPYKTNVPINAQVSVIIDGVEFTECVEVSVLHFLYMTQPNDPESIMKYWDEIDSPMKDKVKDFFRLQGPKRCNNKNIHLRKIWAENLSRIPGIIYRKKTDSSLKSNDVEIAAAWCNYVKAIAYLKNDKSVWNKMSEYAKILTEKEKIFPEIKKVLCDCFKKLAGNKLKSIEWIENGPFEGIRFMDDGSSDLLGTIRCSFEGASEKIDFIMQDGHGFVQWVNLYDDS